MKITKFTDQDTVAAIRKACAELEAGNAKMNAGKKQAEAAKTFLSGLLLTAREIDLAALPIGEMVNVQCDGKDALRVTIGSQKRLDQGNLALAEPEIFARFYKPFPTIGFKALSTIEIAENLSERIDLVIESAGAKLVETVK